MKQESETILVTGASGLLGNALVRRLRNIGSDTVLAPTRSELNLLDRHTVLAYFEKHKPTVVYHLAALVFGLGGNSKNQMRSLDENTQLNANLFSALFEYPASELFFAGTVASYPFPYKSMPLKEADFFLGLPHGGEFGYAMAKRHAFPFLDILAREKAVTYTYGILTNLYGPGDRFDVENGHVVPSLIAKANKAAKEKTALKVWGSGNATRDFLYIDDAARAIEHCISQHHDPDFANQLVNISSAKEVSIRHLAECVAESSGGVALEFDTSGAEGVPRRVIDNTKLLASGFNGFTSIEDGIKATCEWYAENLGRARQ